ncbi:hypothetical protein [Arthrobacter sp. SLBN-100]|uniref:hypothetical protein n=1 Tax=Arthrobacter sp. SLBN-100 TaxID=2768450 RepID=UPI003FA42BFA
MLSGGAGFQILRSPESTDLDAPVRTGNRGRLTDLRAQRRRAARPCGRYRQAQPGPARGPSRIYFRCTPRLTTESSTWSWMNHKSSSAPVNAYPTKLASRSSRSIRRRRAGALSLRAPFAFPSTC